MPSNHQKIYHQPVLLDQVLNFLAPKAGESYLDVTAGYGGHAQAVLEHTYNFLGAVLIDRDPEAVRALGELFTDSGGKIINQDFYSASQELAASGRKFDIILADLGVS